MILMMAEYLKMVSAMADGLRAEGYKVYRSGQSEIVVIDPKTDTFVVTFEVKVK